MTNTHAGRLALSLIPILCLGAQCSFGDNEVGRVKDDCGPPPTDGFVADVAFDSASDLISDAHPAADAIPVRDTAGPDSADSSPTSNTDASGSTCGQTSTSGPGNTLGFQPVTTDGTTFHALVSEVADDHLVLQPDAGAPVTFLWWGPPLSAEFTVGESVNCTQASDWSTVTSGKRSST